LIFRALEEQLAWTALRPKLTTFEFCRIGDKRRSLTKAETRQASKRAPSFFGRAAANHSFVLFRRERRLRQLLKNAWRSTSLQPFTALRGNSASNTNFN